MTPEEHNRLVAEIHANPFGKMLADQVVRLEKENADLKDRVRSAEASEQYNFKKLCELERKYNIKYGLAVAYLRKNMMRNEANAI